MYRATSNSFQFLYKGIIVATVEFMTKKRRLRKIFRCGVRTSWNMIEFTTNRRWIR